METPCTRGGEERTTFGETSLPPTNEMLQGQIFFFYSFVIFLIGSMYKVKKKGSMVKRSMIGESFPFKMKKKRKKEKRQAYES